MESDASLEYLSAQVQLVTATLELKVRALRGAPEEPAVVMRVFEARAANRACGCEVQRHRIGRDKRKGGL